MAIQDAKRILLVDDNPAIHEDFQKILSLDKENNEMDAAKTILFGTVKPFELTPEEKNLYFLDSAFQGQEALEIVKQGILNEKHYALAFVEARMSSGWDGVMTIEHLWAIDPNIQVIICSADADYRWKEIPHRLKHAENFIILKKPFDVIEIKQIVFALTKKWELRQQLEYQIQNLQTLAESRTAELEKSLSLTKTTLESTPEGVLAIDLEQKIIMHNQTFISLWNISENILHQKADTFFRVLAEQVEESSLFIKMMDILSKKPEVGMNIKEWKLKSGKILQLYSQPQLLHSEVIGHVLSFNDITESKRLEEQLLYQATHDSLTGLPNRILLVDRIQQAISSAKRNHSHVGILVIDLDKFKAINDTLGHGAGDILLQLVAERLKGCLRNIDTVIRMGGDEFLIVLVSQIRPEDTISKCKEIIQAFSPPIIIENHTVNVTVSIGVSFYPEDGHDVDVLLKNADAALYHAKEMGRNTFQVYMTEFNENVVERSELIQALRQGLRNQEFILNYQPFFNSDLIDIHGVEALIRWQPANADNLLYPKSFLPLAEEAGIISDIDEWVLKNACKQVKNWQQTIKADLKLAVNISGYQFSQKNFIEFLQNILLETAFNPRLLELEMSESFIFKNISETKQKMLELKNMGITLCIDNFGTGHASFGYLKYFPFDKIKIDRSFIQGIDRNQVDDAIVESIILLANKIGIQVVSECVENLEQAEILLKQHGSQVQGYYCSPPLTAKNCTALLSRKVHS